MASSSVNYEVMVLQGGRWELHGSYPQDQQGQAIKDAKALENISTIKSVKVVREEVVSASGETRENNIYASSNLADEQPQGAKDARLSRQTAPAANKSPDKKSKSRSKPAKSAKNGNMQAGARIPQSIEDYDPDAADKITFSFFRLVVRLLMVVLFSAIIAFVVSGLAGIWLGETSLPASTQATILNGLFFGSFLLSVAWMSFSFLSKARMEASRRAQKAPKPPPPPKPENVPATVKSPNRVDFGKETARMAEETKIAEEATKAVQEAFEADQEDDLSAHVAAPDKPVAVTEAKPVEGLEDIGPAKEEAPWLKKQKTYVMDYLAGALNSANMDRAAMDNFNKFGVNLFIAGAIESLGQSRNMDGNTSSRVLCEAVKSMGFKTRDAEAFPDKIQGYLLADSRYMQMYQAGRGSMMTHLEGDTEGAATLAAALGEWNKPKTKDSSSGMVTVLITDIANSTSITQTLGDALAQQVVRTHNKIVREALHKFNGTEIKHTGDGIMASFQVTSNSVEAAADMQKGTVKFGAMNPDLKFGLKIGINAGEPIAEEDDLFGTTVQMTARIVDRAKSGQIFVSEIVRGLCGGKNFEFRAHTGFLMKGFDAPIALQELIWDPNAVIPPVPVEPEPEPEPETADEIKTGSEISADLETETTEPDAEPEPGQEVATETPPDAAPEANPEPPGEAPNDVPAEETSRQEPSETPQESEKPAPASGPE